MALVFGPRGVDGRLYPMQGSVGYSQLPTLPVIAGVAIAVPPIVQVLRADGSLDTSYIGPVTIKAIGGILSGTATVLAVAGLATFSGLSLTPSGSVVLIAEAPLRGTASTTITVT